MSSQTAAEEAHRLRLLRGDNYQYQPQWVRLTEDKKAAIDAISADKAKTNITRHERSASESSSSSQKSEDDIQLAGFTGVRLL